MLIPIIVLAIGIGIVVCPRQVLHFGSSKGRNQGKWIETEADWDALELKLKSDQPLTDDEKSLVRKYYPHHDSIHIWIARAVGVFVVAGGFVMLFDS